MMETPAEKAHRHRNASLVETRLRDTLTECITNGFYPSLHCLDSSSMPINVTHRAVQCMYNDICKYLQMFVETEVFDLAIIHGDKVFTSPSLTNDDGIPSENDSIDFEATKPMLCSSEEIVANVYRAIHKHDAGVRFPVGLVAVALVELRLIPSWTTGVLGIVRQSWVMD